MSLLKVQSLGVRYGDVAAISDLSFSIESGESVGIVGESGSGKTQTALAILGLLPRSARVAGSISLGGDELLGADDTALDRIRATKIAMVFQDPMQALNPYLRIGDQIELILQQHQSGDPASRMQRVIDMLARVGLPDPARQARAFPHQLSGGMRQRAMIASALITGPDLLIADEPTTALDVTVQAQILDLLDDLREDTALLLITHDLGVVAGRCERMLVMDSGRLVEAGATSELFRAANTEYARNMIAAAPRLTRDDFPRPVTTDPVLELADMSVSYREPGHGSLHAVRSLDLSLGRGETLAIVGESGSGKSSLVRAALGLIPEHTGVVTYLGETLPRSAQARASATRRDLQLVFQDPVASLNPQMRVADIVREPLLVHEPGLSNEDSRQRVVGMLQKLGLGEDYLRRFPHQLSGGQAQRVAIARALILDCKVLVCDEAVAALDGAVREQVLALLRGIQDETGMAILFVSHDLAVVRAISHRVLVMYLGRVLELADNDALFSPCKASLHSSADRRRARSRPGSSKSPRVIGRRGAVNSVTAIGLRVSSALQVRDREVCK